VNVPGLGPFRVPFNTTDPVVSIRIERRKAPGSSTHHRTAPFRFVIDCASAAHSSALKIAIDKKRRMEGKEDSDKEPKLVSTHPQLQKKDAQTKAAKTPPISTKMSMISTLRDLRVNHARPGRAD
jgi:hypothetical protein